MRFPLCGVGGWSGLVNHYCISYDAVMRTTVDLPPAVHRRASEIAAERGMSLSAVVADLTTRGLAELGAPTRLTRDPQTGLPVLTIGRRVTNEDVADALADE